MPIQYGWKVDAVDGKAYRTVLMPDGRWWFARGYERGGDGISILGNSANDAIYGRAYNNRPALPAGTHLPTETEYQDMLDSLGLATIAERSLALRSATTWPTPGTNAFGFDLKASGIDGGNFVGEIAWLLTDTGNPNNYTQIMYQASKDDDYTPELGPHGGERACVRLIVDSGNIPDGALLYGADFDGFERDASVRIERNIRWVDSVGGGVQGIPTMGPLLDTWQISASLRVSQERGAALEAAVGPYIGQTAPTLVLPPRFGQNSFPGLAPAYDSEFGDTYVNPRVIEAGFTSSGRVAIVTDLFEYALSYDLTACPTGDITNEATTPITTAPAWLAGKFARHSIRDLSNERRGVSSNGYYNVTMNPAKHGRRFDYTIDLDILTQAQADELVAYFRGVRHEAYTVYLEFGTEGFASKAAHFRELSFRRNGLHWDGTLEITLARS